MKMRRCFHLINGVPTKVLTLGCDIKTQQSSTLKQLILIIPGNPGLASYYEDFMQKLHHDLKGVPVWTVAHAGHEVPSNNDTQLPPLKGNEEFWVRFCVRGI